jgi:hypothetical protein
MQDILALVRAVTLMWDIQTLAALVLVDIVTGVCAAAKTHTFEFKKLADFMCSTVGPYIVTYAALKIAALAMPDWQPVSLVVFGLISVAMLGSIGSNLRELFGKDIPLPTPHG